MALTDWRINGAVTGPSQRPQSAATGLDAEIIEDDDAGTAVVTQGYGLLSDEFSACSASSNRFRGSTDVNLHQ